MRASLICVKQDFPLCFLWLKNYLRDIINAVCDSCLKGEARMPRYVPYNKMSKRKKREMNNRRRRTWKGLSPVTRKPPNPRAYNRKKRPDDLEKDI